jgi:hypothetical protein
MPAANTTIQYIADSGGRRETVSNPNRSPIMFRCSATLSILFPAIVAGCAALSPAAAQDIPLPQTDMKSDAGPDLLIRNNATSRRNRNAVGIEGWVGGGSAIGLYGLATGNGDDAVEGYASGTNSVAVYGLVNSGSGNIPGEFILSNPNAQFGQTAIDAQNQGGPTCSGCDGRYGNAGHFKITNPNNFDSALIAQTFADEGTGVEGDDNSAGGAVAVYGGSVHGLSALFTGGSGGGGSCSYDGGSNWSCPSPRKFRHASVKVDGDALLDRLAALPIYEYSLKGARRPTRYVGPTSEDFMGAFHLGNSDQSINTANEMGVTLAAAKTLYEKVRRDEKIIASLRDQLAAQKTAMTALTASVASLQRARPMQQASLQGR